MVGSNVYAVRVTCSTMHTIESDKCAWRATPNPKSITMPSPLWLRHNVSIMFLHCLIANSMFIGAQTPAHSPFSSALARSAYNHSFHIRHSPHNSIVAGLTCTVCTVHAHTHTVDIAHSVVGYVSLSFMERIHYIDCRIACRIVERNGVNSNVGHPTTQKTIRRSIICRVICEPKGGTRIMIW